MVERIKLLPHGMRVFSFMFSHLGMSYIFFIFNSFLLVTEFELLGFVDFVCMCNG
jgi:hypothetical protein